MSVNEETPTPEQQSSTEVEVEETMPEKAKPKVSIWQEIKSIAILILAVLGVHSFIAKPFYIPSESMMPGLLVGDRLVVTKYPYGWSWVSPTFHVLPHFKGRLLGSMPERGDIVIATPANEKKEDWIKRVIGLPGDTVELRGGIVYLNGQPLPRGPVHERSFPVDDNNICRGPSSTMRTGPKGEMLCVMEVQTETITRGNGHVRYEIADLPAPENGFGPGRDDFAMIKVPADHVFLMGDNRDDSLDSRFSLEEGGIGGPIPWENIGGRAEFITFSLDGTSQWYNPISWFTAMRGGRAWTSLHPEEVAK